MNIHDVHGHIVVTSNMHKQSLPHTNTHIHMHIHTHTRTNTNKHTLPRIAKTKTQHLQQKHFHQQSHQQKLNAAAISAKAQKLNSFFRPDAPKSKGEEGNFEKVPVGKTGTNDSGPEMQVCFSARSF